MGGQAPEEVGESHDTRSGGRRWTRRGDAQGGAQGGHGGHLRSGQVPSGAPSGAAERGRRFGHGAPQGRGGAAGLQTSHGTGGVPEPSGPGGRFKARCRFQAFLEGGRRVAVGGVGSGREDLCDGDGRGFGPGCAQSLPDPRGILQYPGCCSDLLRRGAGRERISGKLDTRRLAAPLIAVPFGACKRTDFVVRRRRQSSWD
mmetsp:Transcript_78494/g.123809  ORF Transcript_78494/g.123809 Transcript_78494/m.123809 type:complete len:201 (-) Transcript_78494:139-741(-)